MLAEQRRRIAHCGRRAAEFSNGAKHLDPSSRRMFNLLHHRPRLRERHGETLAVDLEQHVALPDLLALLEIDAQDAAIDLRPHDD